MRFHQRLALFCAVPAPPVPHCGVMARNSLVSAPDMSSNPVAIMLYVELGLFLGGLACLVIGRMLEEARTSRALRDTPAPAADTGLALSRLGRT